jgi:hypothetical protein
MYTSLPLFTKYTGWGLCLKAPLRAGVFGQQSYFLGKLHPLKAYRLENRSPVVQPPLSLAVHR